MSKQLKKIFLGSLALIAVCTMLTACGTKTEEEKKVEIKEEIVLTHTTEDGTKINQSDKITKETKKLDGLEFKNITITESGDLTHITFNVYNASNATLVEKDVTIALLNAENEEIKKINYVYIGTINPGETKKCGVEITQDYTEVYDIMFLEQKAIENN